MPWPLRYPLMWLVTRFPSALDRLPKRLRRRVALRAMRETMASWGLPVWSASDEAVEEGCRVLGASTAVRTRVAAVALYDLLRDAS